MWCQLILPLLPGADDAPSGPEAQVFSGTCHRPESWTRSASYIPAGPLPPPLPHSLPEHLLRVFWNSVSRAHIPVSTSSLNMSFLSCFSLNPEVPLDFW